MKGNLEIEKGLGKVKSNRPLLISLVLSLLYSVYSMINFVALLFNSSSYMEFVGHTISTVFLLPHYLFLFIGIIFNSLGLFTKKRGFALTGAVFYFLAIFVFPLYFKFLIIQMILSYIGFSQIEKP